MTRAEVIRRLLDRALEGGDDTASDLAAIEASFGVLHDITPIGREDNERQRHLDDLWRSA